MQHLQTDVLVVGGGAGGTAAAIQAARRGAQTILVSEFEWLGGMLTAAGVSAPDGNELAALQTGIWGTFLRELNRRQPGGLDHAWVSFFTYEPRVGAEIFADWVRSLPNLHWIANQVPLEVRRSSARITGVRFGEYSIEAQIVLDGTELGDLLALAEIPHRWSWEWQSETNEPSAPAEPNELTQRYSVQSPTWVVVLQEFDSNASEIPASPLDGSDRFTQAWRGYSPEAFINYGRLPNNRFMINWPQCGNDYGETIDRLLDPIDRLEFHQEACWHSQNFARFIQAEFGQQFGLATDTFPAAKIGGGAFALHPYYRESRRVQGLVTVREQEILPASGGRVAAWTEGAIAVGNYANDHHYPGFELPLQPKSMRWGGRWTGTPFALPYGCLVPASTDGLLVCEKNISVSHIANGATRLQPIVLNIGQAAGMAAALCIEQNCQPRELNVRSDSRSDSLQAALLQDAIAPAALTPLLNLPPQHPDWLRWQRHYLDAPDEYSIDGNCPAAPFLPPSTAPIVEGEFEPQGEQDYRLILPDKTVLQVVTLQAEIDRQLQTLAAGRVRLQGRVNRSGNWLLVEQMDS
ncbi:FAD-dependent oxidoreductase [Microcoleus sp. FACHB-1515]|nr:FAD-dependent oxidoreductase [Microcoleus sp. FACHB-1515]